MHFIVVHGRTVDIIGYEGYLEDWKLYVGDKSEKDPETIFVDAIEGCYEYNIEEGEGFSLVENGCKFEFECAEDREAYVVNYCGCII